MIEDKDSLAELLRIAGPRPKVSDEMKARVRAAVQEEWQDEVKRRTRVRIIGATGLAAAATIAGFLLLRPVPQTGTTIEIASGSARSMEWGGASLRLDAGTRIRLESDRVATLEAGAIYFSSEGSSGVEIRTPFGAVRDIGTQFEVRLSVDNIRVRVREGRVDLRGTIAGAGTELTATKTSITTRDILRSGSEWAWVEGAAPPIVMEGMTLDELMRRVAREKGLRVEWKNSEAKAKRLHGKVPLSPDEALDAASAAAGVTCTIKNETLSVR